MNQRLKHAAKRKTATSTAMGCFHAIIMQTLYCLQRQIQFINLHYLVRENKNKKQIEKHTQKISMLEVWCTLPNRRQPPRQRQNPRVYPFTAKSRFGDIFITHNQIEIKIIIKKTYISRLMPTPFLIISLNIFSVFSG